MPLMNWGYRYWNCRILRMRRILEFNRSKRCIRAPWLCNAERTKKRPQWYAVNREMNAGP